MSQSFRESGNRGYYTKFSRNFSENLPPSALRGAYPPRPKAAVAEGELNAGCGARQGNAFFDTIFPAMTLSHCIHRRNVRVKRIGSKVASRQPKYALLVLCTLNVIVHCEGFSKDLSLEEAASVCKEHALEWRSGMPVTSSGLKPYGQWPLTKDGLPLTGQRDQVVDWHDITRDRHQASNEVIDCKGQNEFATTKRRMSYDEVVSAFVNKEKVPPVCERYIHTATYFSIESSRIVVDFLVRSENDITNVLTGTFRGIVDFKLKKILNDSCTYKFVAEDSSITMEYCEPEADCSSDFLWGIATIYKNSGRQFKYHNFRWDEEPLELWGHSP